ncbi:LuxR family transcriptional regulator [Pseudonocardia nigra]|uniref:LuxR family transcriptional regulator n=1 Tax=Pseudonocardia nigra TaxID=1921578 RepID=UPI001C5F296D|nr:LuxR family transcriptional regulator [Pseudonocardia nigra]
MREVGDCPERGRVALLGALFTEDPEERERHVAAAEAIAERFGDTDLGFDALSYVGWCLIERGRIDEGMLRLDEAVAAATNGEVANPADIGDIYCKMLFACELARDVRRAEQWMAVAESWVDRTGAVPVSTIYCRTYYCGILTAAGRWGEAERELEWSVRRHDPAYPGLRAGALIRLADLRVRQGRLEEAAQLLGGHEHDPAAVAPIARLHLARGDAELAVCVLRRHLTRHGDGVLHAPVLTLLAEAEIAAGRVENAEVVGGRLRELATGSHALVVALADYVAGLACDAAGDEEAVRHLEAALGRFGSAGLPYEEARTRLALARALAATSPGIAMAEAHAALEQFEQMSAAPDADAAASVLRRLGGPGRRRPRRAGPLTQRETEVLGLLTEGMSNEQIAQRLTISRRTAEHHVSSVLAKLGVVSRAEAVARTLRTSDLPPHGRRLVRQPFGTRK